MLQWQELALPHEDDGRMPFTDVWWRLSCTGIHIPGMLARGQ